MNDLITTGGPESSKGRVEAVKNALRYPVELFSGEDEIWPDQCDYANSRLGLIKALLQDCCRFLNSDLCFPLFAPPQQIANEFTVTLYYAREQLDELRELVAAFQPMCRSSSKRAWKKRAEILSKLEQFMHHSDDIVHSITILQKRSSHHFVETNARISPAQSKENELRSCQLQGEEGRRNRSSDGKSRPPLTLIRGGSREKRHLLDEEASCN